MENPPLNIQILFPKSEMSFASRWYELADKRHFWMQWRLRAFLNQCKRIGIETETPMLGMEIGCGHGVFRNQIEQHTDWIVDGVDLDLGSLQSNSAVRGNLYLYDVLEKIKYLKTNMILYFYSMF